MCSSDLELVTLFTESLPNAKIRLEEAVSANDRTTIASVAHSIKGGALNCNADEVMKIFSELEETAHSLSHNQLSEILVSCDLAIARLMQDANALLSTHKV